MHNVFDMVSGHILRYVENILVEASTLTEWLRGFDIVIYNVVVLYGSHERNHVVEYYPTG